MTVTEFDTQVCQLDACAKGESCATEALPETLYASADALAGQLINTPAFEDYLRKDRALRTDETARQLREQIRMGEAEFAFVAVDALETRLDTLAVTQDFETSQQAARSLFAAVERAISAAAGLAFAENARPAGFS